MSFVLSTSTAWRATSGLPGGRSCRVPPPFLLATLPATIPPAALRSASVLPQTAPPLPGSAPPPATPSGLLSHSASMAAPPTPPSAPAPCSAATAPAQTGAPPLCSTALLRAPPDTPPVASLPARRPAPPPLPAPRPGAFPAPVRSRRAPAGTRAASPGGPTVPGTPKRHRLDSGLDPRCDTSARHHLRCKAPEGTSPRSGQGG